MTRAGDEDVSVPRPPGAEHPISVADLLAANGRAAATPGGRRRKPDADPPQPDPPQPHVATPGGRRRKLEPPQPVPRATEPADAELAPDNLADPAPAADPAPTADPADEPAPVRSASSAREWAMVIGQLVFALGGGAALWFGFRYLWAGAPVLALVMSLVVTVALVALVRVLRRGDDLLSTLLAVLAGLIVTVSPPVLTLTGN